MRKILKTILISAMFLMFVPIMEISASSFTASASVKTVAPGGSFSININYPGEGRFEVAVKNGSGGEIFWYDRPKSVPVTAGQSGEVLVTVTAVDATANGVLIENVSVVIKVPIVKPAPPKPDPKPDPTPTPKPTPTPTPKPTPTPTPKPTPTPPSTGTYDPDPIETEEERIAKQEAEEKKRIENLTNTPLITVLEVISQDGKRNGQVLQTIKPEYGVFEYSVELPTFINDISFKLTPLSEDVTFKMEEKYTVDGELKVVLVAETAAITQEFVVNVKENEVKQVLVDGSNIYTDDLLKDKFAAYGFSDTVIEKGDSSFNMFISENMNLQMVINDENKVHFVRLTDEGEIIDTGQVLVVDDKLLFAPAKLDEELESQTLYGNKSTSIEMAIPSFLSEVDESLTLVDNIKGWNHANGSLIYTTDGLTDELTNINEVKVQFAVAAFDKTSNVQRYTIIGLTTALVAVLATNAVYLIVKFKRKENY